MYGSTWRADVGRAGAGTLLEHSIHDLDIIEWLAGPLARVGALSSSFHGLTGIEDAVSVSLSFAGGAVGSLVSVWHDVLARPSSRHVEVLCENLWCALDTDDWWGPVRWTDGETTQSLEGAALGEKVWAAGLAPVNPDESFLDALDEKPAVGPDFDDAVRAHVLVDAAYRSAAGGGAPLPVPAPGDASAPQR